MKHGCYLPYPEAVDFLNTMARRARKRNVSLAIISQRFQDFYENQKHKQY